MQGPVIIIPQFRVVPSVTGIGWYQVQQFSTQHGEYVNEGIYRGETAAQDAITRRTAAAVKVSHDVRAQGHYITAKSATVELTVHTVNGTPAEILQAADEFTAKAARLLRNADILRAAELSERNKGEV